MKAPRTATLTLERASQLFDYNPETGSLIWRDRPESDFASSWAWKVWSKKYPGKEAGHLNPDGYRQVHITTESNRHIQKVHRIVWLLVHGSLPSGLMDHINGDRSDNRIENLRVVDHVLNARNMKMTRRNKSGVIGVSWSRAQMMWQARIRADGGNLHLGSFHTIAEAAAARAKAELAHDYHPNHGRKS